MLLAIIAILVSVWLYRRGRLHRAIACYFDPLISPIEIKAGDAIMGDIKILYQDKPIQNLFILRVTIRNTGNMAIRAADIFEPLSFTFADGAEVIRSPRVISSKPSNLRYEWSVIKNSANSTSDSATLNFDLLNPGDEQTVEFIYTGNDNVPIVAARIEGISKIETTNTDDPVRKNRILSRIAYLLSAVGTLIYLLVINPVMVNDVGDFIGLSILFAFFSFLGWLGLILLLSLRLPEPKKRNKTT